MAFSVSPAVTVQEIDATASVIATSTSPGAIVGVFRWGPVNERVLVSSEEELAEVFGRPASYTSGNTTWSNVETFFTGAGFLNYSNALYVTRVVAESDPRTITAKSANFEAKYPGILGNSIKVSYTTNAGYDDPVFTTSSIINSNMIDYNTNTFTIVSLVDYTASLNVGDVLRVGTSEIGHQNLVIESVNMTSTVIPGDTPTTHYTHVITFKNRYTMTELDYSALQYSRVWGYNAVAPIAPDAGNIHLVVVDATGGISGVVGSVLEVYENVSLSPSARLDDGTSNYYANAIEARSKWIKVTDTATVGTDSIEFAYTQLSGGSDGSGEGTITFGALARGWDLYKEANDVDVAFLLQGKANGSANLANYIVQNIAEYRKDCMAFLSPRFEDVVTPATSQGKLNGVLAYRNAVQNSSYWFMDSGYKYRYDKYNDVYRWVPLNGDTAGLSARIQPWESPAGYKRGIIKNVVKLAFNPNKAQRDELFVRDVNPVMSQAGTGTILFGDKTGLGYGSAFNRINVRRLFIVVEKAIATAAAQFLFDFNDEFTQTQFRNMVEPYLRDIQGQRGIIDFTVVSDARVNTPDVVDANIFRGNIYIKPARTITEIQLKFIATRTSTEFEEIIGQTI